MDESSNKLDSYSIKCDTEMSDAETTASEESETLGNKLQLVRSMQSQILVTIQDVSSRLLQNPFSQDLWQLLLTLSHCGCEQVAFEETLRSNDSLNQQRDTETHAHRVDAMLDAVFTLGSQTISMTPKPLITIGKQNISRRTSLNASPSKSIKNRKANPRCKNVRNGEFYYVEKILDRKMHNGKPLYYVKWIGYPSTNNTWEPKESFLSQDFVDDYDRRVRRKRLSHQRRKTITGSEGVKTPLQPLKHFVSRTDNSPKISQSSNCEDKNRRSTRLLRKSMPSG